MYSALCSALKARYSIVKLDRWADKAFISEVDIHGHHLEAIQNSYCCDGSF